MRLFRPSGRQWTKIGDMHERDHAIILARLVMFISFAFTQMIQPKRKRQSVMTVAVILDVVRLAIRVATYAVHIMCGRLIADRLIPVASMSVAAIPEIREIRFDWPHHRLGASFLLCIEACPLLQSLHVVNCHGIPFP